MGAEGKQGTDISKEQPFGLARMQSIIQAGCSVVHCIGANVNMIPYPMWNSSYVIVVPLRANNTRERKQCEIDWDNSFIVVTIVASITSRVCWFAKSGTIQYVKAQDWGFCGGVLFDEMEKCFTRKGRAQRNQMHAKFFVKSWGRNHLTAAFVNVLLPMCSKQNVAVQPECLHSSFHFRHRPIKHPE